MSFFVGSRESSESSSASSSRATRDERGARSSVGEWCDDVDALSRVDDDDVNAMLRPSVYAITREIKRRGGGASERLRSIAADARWTRAATTERFGSLPVFANARCGKWYVDAPECYFKSTDGHDKNWAFSGVRLNARVAREAAARGGCVVVDATASAVKRFPDAMSKTVPIWCETLNRAVARAGGVRWREGDDRGVTLPEWISTNEREAVNARREQFDESLRRSGWDAGNELKDILKKPFQCVWVSQGDDGSELTLETLRAADFTPIVLLSASAPLLGRGERSVGDDGRAFTYVPGAGDDEESWARGLTPEIYRKHRDSLLRANQGDVDVLISKLVARSRDSEGTGEYSETVIELDPECGLGACRVASRRVYDRPDVNNLADAFLHVGELAVESSRLATPFLHVSAKKDKISRSDLRNAIEPSIQFVRRSLPTPKGRLCVTCDDGVDHSVAMVIALSIALCPQSLGANLTKDDIRRRLAVISRTHPDARPSRGSLKQVYNHFVG